MLYRAFSAIWQVILGYEQRNSDTPGGSRDAVSEMMLEYLGQAEQLTIVWKRQMKVEHY